MLALQIIIAAHRRHAVELEFRLDKFFDSYSDLVIDSTDQLWLTVIGEPAKPDAPKPEAPK